MANFYGTVQGGRGKATRLGHNYLDVTAQSYEGSVIVRLFELDGTQHASIRVGAGSTGQGTYSLYSGPIKGLFSDQTNFRR